MSPWHLDRQEDQDTVLQGKNDVMAQVCTSPGAPHRCYQWGKCLLKPRSLNCKLKLRV